MSNNKKLYFQHCEKIIFTGLHNCYCNERVIFYKLALNAMVKVESLNSLKFT